ncbi:MAG: NAD(P)H-dependent glycerol-3-phosphate dehydrogenase [Pseudomonadota bacterium]
MTNNTSVGVIGAGSYGTALAFVLSRNNVTARLWGRDSQHISALQSNNTNEKYLPGFSFPDKLEPTASLEACIVDAKYILVVVPSHAFGEILREISPLLTPSQQIVWASKGLEPKTGRLLSDVYKDQIGDRPHGVISGPTFAKEMAAGLPTAITLSSKDQTLLDDFSTLLHDPKSFRVYLNHDLIGVQLGGAVKNVIAIGAGLADGLGFGANARTALITRGLAELTRLGISMGATNDAFMGMSGLGDLVLTCTDNQSRNRRFGMALGQGLSVQDAIESIGQVVEGFRNTEEVHALARRQNIEMPICEQIYHILYEGKDPKIAALALLGREQKVE